MQPLTKALMDRDERADADRRRVAAEIEMARIAAEPDRLRAETTLLQARTQSEAELLRARAQTAQQISGMEVVRATARVDVIRAWCGFVTVVLAVGGIFAVFLALALTGGGAP